MLKKGLLFICMITGVVYAQNHDENIKTIATVDEAKDYASSFSEVSCGLMNAEKDVLFFDEIDTTNLEDHIGTYHSFFGRTTKLLKDSIVSIVNVQMITLDLSKTSPETAEILLNQMKKRLANGESYWDIKQKYKHTSAFFSSSPEPAQDIERIYGLSQDQMTAGTQHTWQTFGRTDKIGILIVEEEVHDVPGFYTISYLNLNNGDVR